MKLFVALSALVLSASAAAITPSQVVQLVTQKTSLFSQGSPKCDAREQFFRSASYPVDTTSDDMFIKTYKYAYNNIFDSLAQMELDDAVKSFSDLKWDKAGWKPWRRFDTVGIPEMSPYTFYVEVIAPEFDELDTMDYTAVCITVTKLR